MIEDMHTKTNVTELSQPTTPEGQPAPSEKYPRPATKSLLEQPDKRFLDRMAAIFDQIDDLILQREDINAQIKAEKTGLEADGINGHAFKAVMAFRKLSEDQQVNYDLTNQVLRRAIKAPVQMDLLLAQAARTH